MTAIISPKINRGMMSPVEGLAPNANAKRVTLKMERPFNPALEVPIKNVAVAAKAQAIKEGSNVVDSVKFGV